MRREPKLERERQQAESQQKYIKRRRLLTATVAKWIVLNA